MLLPLLLNLGFAAGTVITPPPTPPITDVEGSGISYYQQLSREKNQRVLEKRIQIEDSEIIAIVEITLKHFII